MDQTSSSILGDGQINRSTTACIPIDGKNFELRELENRLNYDLEECHIEDVRQLTERLKPTEKRIEQYENEERIEAAEQEMRYMCDLEELQRITEEIFFRKSTGPTVKSDIEANKRMDLKNVRDEFAPMLCCAEKTVMEILAYFQQKLLRDYIDEHAPDSVTLKLGKLQDQVQREKLFSEQIRTYLQDLNRTTASLTHKFLTLER